MFDTPGTYLSPAPNACRVDYNRLSNGLALETDSGGYDPSLMTQLGTGANPAIIQNSQCVVNAAQSSTQVVDANTLELDLAITFKTPWAGTAQTDYLYVWDRANLGGGWLTAGPYTITGPSTTITSSPPGLQITVDGTSYTTPQTFSWAAGTTHTITAPATVSGTGMQGTFSSWSDGGAISHTITVGGSSATYTAIYAMLYQLTASASPANEGTVTLSPTNSAGASPGWYTGGAQVTMSAMPNPGYVFTGFSGAQTAPAAQGSSIALVVNGPIAETAQFLPDFTLAISPSYQTVPVSGQAVPYSVTVASPSGYTGTVWLMLTAVSSSCLDIPYFPATATAGGAPATFNISVVCGAGSTQTLTVGGCVGATWHYVTATVNIATAADFTVTASAPSLSSVPAPGSVSYTIQVSPVNAFTGAVTLSAGGMPTGTSASSVGTFTPSSLQFSGSNTPQTATLTVSTPAGAPPGTYSVTIVGVSGSTARYAIASLVISGTPQSTDLDQMAVLSVLVSRHEALAGPNAPTDGGGLYGLPANDAATVNAAMDAASGQLGGLFGQSQTFTDGTAYMNAQNAILQGLNQQLQTQISASSAQVMESYINSFISPRLARVTLNSTTGTAQATPSCSGSTETTENDCLGIWNEIAFYNAGSGNQGLGRYVLSQVVGAAANQFCSDLTGIKETFTPLGGSPQKGGGQNWDICGGQAYKPQTMYSPQRGTYLQEVVHSFTENGTQVAPPFPSLSPWPPPPATPGATWFIDPNSGYDAYTTAVDLQFNVAGLVAAGGAPQVISTGQTVTVSGCSAPVVITAVLTPAATFGSAPTIKWTGATPVPNTMTATVPCKVGAPTVTASITGGSLSATVTLNVVPMLVTLTPAQIVTGVGTQFSLTASVDQVGSYKYSWSISPGIASFSGNCQNQITCTFTAGGSGGTATVQVTVTDGSGNLMGSATALVTVVQVTLTSISWTSPSGTMTTMMKQSATSSWTNDGIGPEGVVAISNPVWTCCAADGQTPTLSDPVVYQANGTAAIYPLTFTVSPQVDMSNTGATLQITGNSAYLTFNNSEFKLQQSQGVYTWPYGASSTSQMPSSIANFSATLTFTVLWNGGGSSVIATPTQQIFVTLGPPTGLNGFGNSTAQTVTAARVNFVTGTSIFGGLSSQAAVMQAAMTEVYGGVTPNPNAPGQFLDGLFLGANVSLGDNNPWAYIAQAVIQQQNQQRKTQGFDCISLSVVTLVLLQHAGVSAYGHYAYALAGPSPYLDATVPTQYKDADGKVLQNLDWYPSSGTGAQSFEAYVFLCSGGLATEADTLWPKEGPYQGLAADTVNPPDVCAPPSQGAYSPAPPRRLALSVIFNTLLLYQNPPAGWPAVVPPMGGRQWWVDVSLNPVQGPVPFPIQGVQ